MMLPQTLHDVLCVCKVGSSHVTMVLCSWLRDEEAGQVLRDYLHEYIIYYIKIKNINGALYYDLLGVLPTESQEFPFHLLLRESVESTVVQS